jgi:pimeloyl-ACP methyl ester carboxylesterase
MQNSGTAGVSNVVLVVRVALVALLVGGTLGLASPSPAGAAPPQVSVAWSPCHRNVGPYECGTVQVPIDYDAPTGGTISLALIRLRATGDPSERIGSLFVNPGGPGNSGVDLVLFEGPTLFPRAVHERFDIVGFDPRGVARSTGLRCFGTNRQGQAVGPPFPFPVTEEEEAAWIAAERAIDAQCARRGGRIAEHISTANVARDLDQLRVAVGDAQLTYYGVSYGTVIGQTYANLFPERVRAIGIDSVVDPVAWTNEGGTEPIMSKLRSAAGAQATLEEFFRLCDENPAGCALAPDSGERFAALADRLREAPIVIADPAAGPIEYRYSFLIADALVAMYEAPSWPSFAELLELLEQQPGAVATIGRARAAFQATLDGGLGTKRGFPRYDNWFEGQASTACNDTAGPTGYQAWIDAAHADDPAAGYFGDIWTWFTSICAEWPFDDLDRYPGPWTAATANPVLVIGTRFDPATPFEGAQAAAGLLPNSVLLTLEGWGHIGIQESACADAIIAGYLVDLTLPSAGTVCSYDRTPFADPPSS